MERLIGLLFLIPFAANAQGISSPAGQSVAAGSPAITAAAGGTGVSSLTAHAVLVGATTKIGFVNPSSGGNLLVDQGSSADPVFKTMSQDCTLASGGIITCTKTNGTSFTPYATATIGQLPGTTTNDSATTGNMGQLLSGTAAAGSVSLTSGMAATVTSVSLTAGDWDCRGVVSRTFGALTSITELIQSISQTTNTLSGSLIDGSTTELDTAANIMVGSTTLSVGPFRVSLAMTTTVYLVVQDTFTASTDAVGGGLQCRRVR